MTTVENIDKEIEQLRERKEQLVKNRTIKCPICEKKTAIKNATVIVNYFYVKPRGCTEGDYWSFDNEYHYYCNKCKSFARTYIMHHEKEGRNQNYLSPMTEKEDKDRIEFYNFINQHNQYFGERLVNYGWDGTIHNIREQNKKTQSNKRIRRVVNHMANKWTIDKE